MASDMKNEALRRMFSIRKLFGITSSQEISDSNATPTAAIHYGMFSSDELRHLDGVFRNYAEKSSKSLTEDNISSQLAEIATNSRKKIDEIKNLRMLAPEIEQAKSIIVSSIISPTDLQTDCVSVKVEHPGLTPELNAKITDKLTDYFNNEFHLASKLSEWLGCAGFEEGAKPLLVLPRSQIDVLNVVADQWDPDTLREFKECKQRALHSTESLLPRNADDVKKVEDLITNMVTVRLEDDQIGKEFVSTEALNEYAKTHKADPILSSSELARALVSKSFNLLRTSEMGDCVTVTRDLSDFGKNERATDAALAKLEAEAEQQITGFKASDQGRINPTTPVFTVSDIIKTGEKDLPIVIELPCDSVIPVCAPRDHKNHIGYYILLDENGQPCRAQYTQNLGIDQDSNMRLATNAARQTYGSNIMNTYLQAGMTNAQALDQMTQLFVVAVNHLLDSKLKKDGLTGLDVNVHEAVGKAIFFNLLAKNKIKMVFVPAPMMIYYRFLHREDGTGKTFLEDIAYILALRCTLTVAKLMAAIDNATKHRKIEVNIDEKNQNPLQTLEVVRNSWMSKKVPQISTDPKTAAESIINSHLSIVPKGLVGNTDDLSITTETGYGQSQAPDNDLMEQLNNWVGMGLKIPPSALNQLNETEYAKSVATSNLFFSNAVRGWQNTIKPFNKKFVLNYILCNQQLINEVRQLIVDENSGTTTTTKEGTKVTVDNPTEHQSQDPEKNQATEEQLKQVLATVEVVLPPPNMSMNKAKYEEVSAQVDAVDKILEKIYPDDFAVNDELKGLMGAVRSIISSKAIREFLPTVGFHQLANVPALDEINSDESANAMLFLGNLKRRMDNLNKLQSAQMGAGAPEDNNPAGGTGEQGAETGDDFGNEFKI